MDDERAEAISQNLGSKGMCRGVLSLDANRARRASLHLTAFPLARLCGPTDVKKRQEGVAQLEEAIANDTLEVGQLPPFRPHRTSTVPCAPLG
jgi:hypothetical protein